MGALNFVIQTKGVLDIDKMFNDIVEFIKDDKNSKYKLMIGTDSQPGKVICFVSAVIIYREGKGARYYYRKFQHKKIPSLRQRIFMEANYSIELANILSSKFEKMGKKDFNIEIHLDVGENGMTKDIIKEVVGMVTGCGFDAQVKPDSYGASKVADKHTKLM